MGVGDFDVEYFVLEDDGLYEAYMHRINGLQTRIVRAIDILAPFFDLRLEHLTYPKPEVFVATAEQLPKCFGIFRPSLNTITIREDHVADALPIGEESSHYMHYQINKWGSFTDNFQAFRLYSALETVGRYGALVYLDKINLAIPDVEELAKKYENADELLQHFGHKVGYQRAHDIMERFGHKRLADISRSSVDDIERDYRMNMSLENYYDKYVIPELAAFSKRL